MEEGLSCLKCSNVICSSPLKIKGAPSENWREVIELWQCHNENFDKLIDAETRRV